eukprot:TRINITY_DN4730_c0_g1_i15.p1 TRINITY_DN4730_c0_g1~~TRINITY_DN4730_c0_g1_i15.p1  ORF type:complete len:270 (-),score=-22.60 TRINITY_DN4730_c0_g1_i15:521-1330(-)
MFVCIKKNRFYLIRNGIYTVEVKIQKQITLFFVFLEFYFTMNQFIIKLDNVPFNLQKISSNIYERMSSTSKFLLYIESILQMFIKEYQLYIENIQIFIKEYKLQVNSCYIYKVLYCVPIYLQLLIFYKFFYCYIMHIQYGTSKLSLYTRSWFFHLCINYLYCLCIFIFLLLINGSLLFLYFPSLLLKLSNILQQYTNDILFIFYLALSIILFSISCQIVFQIITNYAIYCFAQKTLVQLKKLRIFKIQRIILKSNAHQMRLCLACVNSK